MRILAAAALLLSAAASANAACPYGQDCPSDPYGGTYGYDSDAATESYGLYGNPDATAEAVNPYARSNPHLYDENGEYRGYYAPDEPYSAYSNYGRKEVPSTGASTGLYHPGSPYRY